MLEKIKYYLYKTLQFVLPYLFIGLFAVCVVSVVLILVLKSTNDHTNEASYIRHCKQLTNNQNAVYIGRSINHYNFGTIDTIFCGEQIPGTNDEYQIKTFDILEATEWIYTYGYMTIRRTISFPYSQTAFPTYQVSFLAEDINNKPTVNHMKGSQVFLIELITDGFSYGVGAVYIDHDDNHVYVPEKFMINSSFNKAFREICSIEPQTCKLETFTITNRNLWLELQQHSNQLIV